MTQTAENVRVGATGAVFFAPAGTPLPTSTSTTLNAAFVDVGYLTEDGVAIAPENSVNKIKAWGGDVVRAIENEHSATVAFAMQETTNASAALYFGDGSTAADASIKGGVQVRGCFVVDVYDGDATFRYVIGDGEVTGRQPLSNATADAITYGITVEAYPYDVDKRKVRRYYDDGAVS